MGENVMGSRAGKPHTKLALEPVHTASMGTAGLGPLRHGPKTSLVGGQDDQSTRAFDDWDGWTIRDGVPSRTLGRRTGFCKRKGNTKARKNESPKVLALCGNRGQSF
jgi:hypothetical protein